MQLNFTTVTWPVLAIWGLGLLAVAVGFLIGYIDSNIRSAKKIENAESKANVIRAESEKRLADAEALKAKSFTVADDPGLLRLKNKNGVPSLELDGTILTKNISADQKKRLIELLSIIRPWLESGQSVSPSASAPTQTAPSPVPAPLTSSALSSSPTKPLPAANLTDKEFKALSIIAQIDYVFQARIAGTPYEGMGIRIMEGAVGSVEVKIGSNKYPSIDDVPDADIKKSIRAAVAEWEEKYIPGP